MAPTSIGLCGLPVPDGMQGRDLSCLRQGKSASRTRYPLTSALVKPFRHGNSIDRPWRGIVTDDGWKYVCLEGQPWLM